MNTIINWGSSQIVHYPHDEHFPGQQGSRANASRQPVVLSFQREGLAEKSVREALAVPNHRRYLQNFTGLPDPGVLIEVGDYYQKLARSWISVSNEIRAAWLGCSYDYFNLGGGNYLDSTDAVRGVSLVGPVGGAP